MTRLNRELDQVRVSIVDWRRLAPLLAQRDTWPGMPQLLLLEIDELAGALFAYGATGPIPPEGLECINHELADVFILMEVIVRTQGLSLDLDTTNGSSLLTLGLTTLMELIHEAGERLVREGISYATLTTIYRCWLELVVKLGAQDNISAWIGKKIDLNKNNRPFQHYQNSSNGAGKESLSEETLFRIYNHVERCLRLLRDHYSQKIGRKISLRWWMYQPVAPLIDDYHKSDETIQSLRGWLEHQGTNYFQKLLLDCLNGQIIVPNQDLQMISILAGGVLVS